MKRRYYLRTRIMKRRYYLHCYDVYTLTMKTGKEEIPLLKFSERDLGYRKDDEIDFDEFWETVDEYISDWFNGWLPRYEVC